MTKSVKIADIRAGDTVYYKDQFGKLHRGRAVMPSALSYSWVLNTGGRYGTPQIVDVQNFVSVSKKLRKVS